MGGFVSSNLLYICEDSIVRFKGEEIIIEGLYEEIIPTVELICDFP